MTDDSLPQRPEAALSINKHSVILRISDESLFGPTDLRPGHSEPPTDEELAAFREWKSEFRVLYREGERHGWFNVGGPDYGFEYRQPEGHWVYDDEDTK